MDQQNYYAELELGKDATKQQIADAYAMRLSLVIGEWP